MSAGGLAPLRYNCTELGLDAAYIEKRCTPYTTTVPCRADIAVDVRRGLAPLRYNGTEISI